MTVSSETRTAGPFTGNGVTTAFPFTFRVFAQTDVLVVQTDTDGVEDELTLTTDYTVALNADQDDNPGGTVTLNSALTTDYLLTLTSQVQNTQLTELTNGGGFYPSVITAALDKAVVLIQQLLNKVNRSIKVPISDGTSVTTELPTASLRANKAVVFDADGNITVSADDYDDQAANAAASAAAAASSASAASTSASSASSSASSASSSASSASASAAAAAATLNSALWRDVVFVTSASSPITISSSDNGKLYRCDTSGGAITFNLPQISGLTLPFNVSIKKETADANNITINRAGTDTIDGATSKTILSAGGGTTLLGDTDPAPDQWTAADFGAVAGNMTADLFSGNGATTSFTLSVAPGSAVNVAVSISGVRQRPTTDYTVSGTTLTFLSAPALGTNNILAVSGTTLSIGTPADGTVTGVKLSAGGMTSAELRGALSDETGSGAAVFATSPTLVTPTLGVAAATSVNFGQDPLNYYDEGTFTPTIQGTSTAGSGTYTGNRSGQYTRVGNRVDFVVRIEWTAHTGTGNMELTGLPFTVGSISVPAHTVQNGIASPASSQVKALAGTGSTKLTFYSEVVSTGALAALAIDTAADLYVQGTYFV